MDLLRRRNMMQGADGPVFVDWIENTGLEYISYPFTAGPYSRADAIAMFKSSGATMLFWDRIAIKNREFAMSYNGSGAVLFRLGSADGADVALNPVGSKYKFIVGSTVSYSHIFGKVENLDGSQVVLSRNIPISEGYIGITPVTLFGADGTATSGILRLWDIIFIKDVGAMDSLIRLRPCYYNGEYGLWDTVNNKFYGNVSGEGAFIGGYDE